MHMAVSRSISRLVMQSLQRFWSWNPIELRCLKERAKYTCPRCNVPYCSIGCYRSKGHMTCSESFYKDCFMEGLQNHNVSNEEKNKVMEMLERAETENADVLDSDDDELDLRERLAGLDLDTDSEKIWSRLTDKEKEEFERIASDGRLGNLVEVWTPWWAKKEKLVQDTEKEERSYLPPILSDIPDIATLLKKSKPSSDIKHNIVNVLYAYAFVCRLHNGDQITCSPQSAKELLMVSEVLDKNIVCSNPSEAVQCCMRCIQQNPSLSVEQGFQVSVISDVIAILSGPSQTKPLQYVLCAVSEVHRIIAWCKKQRGKHSSEEQDTDIDLDRKKMTVVKKKLLFLLGWTERFGMVLQTLIPELQLEHSKSDH